VKPIYYETKREKYEGTRHIKSPLSEKVEGARPPCPDLIASTLVINVGAGRHVSRYRCACAFLTNRDSVYFVYLPYTLALRNQSTCEQNHKQSKRMTQNQRSACGNFPGTNIHFLHSTSTNRKSTFSIGSGCELRLSFAAKATLKWRRLATGLLRIS